MLFKLVKGAGNHQQKNSKGKLITYNYSDGNIIDSDINLCEKFPNKFERCDLVPAKPPKQVEPDDIDEDEDEEENEESLGKDVTKKFPRAQEEDYKVFYTKGKGYFVTEADEPFTALNKKKLSKAIKVEPFIEKLLKD